MTTLFFDPRTREVSLPRFKLERNYDLIENLKKMGLTDIFKQSGDFSRMTSEKVTMNWVSKTKSLMKNKQCTLLFVHSSDPLPSCCPAEAPGNHHRERRGNRSCCSDPSGLHAALLSDPFRCGSPVPLPHLRTSHRLPRLHRPGRESLTELNYS